MKQENYPVEKIIQILSEAELLGGSIAEVCRKLRSLPLADGICRGTFERWRKKYKGFSADEARKLKVLEDENMRLKRLLAEKELELQVLKDIVKKTSDHSEAKACIILFVQESGHPLLIPP